MKQSRYGIFISFFFSVLFFAPTIAQQSTNDSLRVVADSGKSQWLFGADTYYYILAGEANTTTIIGYADCRNIHLEVRYNYEGSRTISALGGYRFEAGKKLHLGITPMLGFVFGEIKGIIPAYELDITWKKFDLYSESEFVIDYAGKENNYFYTWSEIAITPIKNFRTGISINRTRLYQSRYDIQRGIFAQYSFWKLTTGIHYFNPFNNDSFVIATLGIEF